MIFTWISKNKCHWPVRVMCHVLQISSSGYYKWCRNTTGRLMAAREVALWRSRLSMPRSKSITRSPRIHRGFDPDRRSANLGFRLLAVHVGG